MYPGTSLQHYTLEKWYSRGSMLGDVQKNVLKFFRRLDNQPIGIIAFVYFRLRGESDVCGRCLSCRESVGTTWLANIISEVPQLSRRHCGRDKPGWRL